jgi:uncharacterized protein (DUF2141 family)
MPKNNHGCLGYKIKLEYKMKAINKYFVLMVLIAVGLLHISASVNDAHAINVKITNVRSGKGRIQVQIYRDQESFGKETPWKVMYASKDDLKNNTMSYTITGIPSGTYGIAILDDENGNKEMDYSLMMPKEGFGFSNYYHTAWSKPKFQSFKFTVSGETSVNIKVRYV